MPTSYELKQIEEIRNWGTRPPGMISTIATKMFLKPVSGLIAKAIPDQAMLAAIHLGNAAGQNLARIQTIRKAAGVSQCEELRTKDLALSDSIAWKEEKWAMASAAICGGATGTFGLPGLIADVPLLVALAMRAIHVTGICYGYDLSSELDRRFAIGILSASGASTLEEKLSAIRYLCDVSPSRSSADIAAIAVQQADILAAQILFKQIGVNMVRRKLAQSIPLLGIGIGATVNGWYLHDVCSSARCAFQSRWLVENGISSYDILFPCVGASSLPLPG